MYDKKTELILKWQYRKDHFYFFLMMIGISKITLKIFH